jgi:hypothetical protein
MADKPLPQKPIGPRMSHLQSEPISMSFASPQQLANLASGSGSLFPRPPTHTTNQSFMPMMNSGFNMNQGLNMHDTNHQIQTVPTMSNNLVAAVAAAAADIESQSASSVQKPLKPLPAQAIDLDNFKGFKFVTLDGLQIETREIYDKISGTFQWEVCESQEDRCISFIRDKCGNKRVFIISSGSLGSSIVPQIHELPQVYAIYIYCVNVKYHQEWANNFPKVRVVCDNDDRDLLPRFAVDVAQSNVDWGDALFKKGTHDKAKEKFQLALDKLTNHAPNHDQAMDLEIKKKIEECK